MAVYDWVKTLCVEGVPALPRPFDWVSEFVNVHIVFPVCRTFQEAASGGRLCLSVLLDIWEHREWWVNQLQSKLDKLFERGKVLAAQLANAATETAVDFARRGLAALGASLASATATVNSLILYVGRIFTTWLANTFGPWKVWLDVWVASVKIALATLAAFTTDSVRYWVSIYTAFRTQLSAFLSDPATWILAEIELNLGRTRATLLRLATLVLDMAW